MRKQSWLFVFLFLNLSVFFSLCQAAEGIRWRQWSPLIFELAKKEHKLILIYGKINSCPWCQKMDNFSFTDPAVAQLVSEDYVAVKVDIQQETALANRYQISEIPSLIILDARNKELKRFYGYTSPQSLLSKLSGLSQQYR